MAASSGFSPFSSALLLGDILFVRFRPGHRRTATGNRGLSVTLHTPRCPVLYGFRYGTQIIEVNMDKAISSGPYSFQRTMILPLICVDADVNSEFFLYARQPHNRRCLHQTARDLNVSFTLAHYGVRSTIPGLSFRATSVLKEAVKGLPVKPVVDSTSPVNMRYHARRHKFNGAPLFAQGTDA